MKYRVLIVFIFYGLSTAYTQKIVEPFQTHNQSPLIHFFGLPNNNGGKVLSKSQFTFGNYLNIANNATSSQLKEEAIYLDGEMYRNDILLKYGITNRLQLELNMPLIRHSTGLMDPFISGWHNTFGLPGKARDIMEDYKLSYLYRENDKTYIQMTESKLDIGDISLRITTPLIRKSNHLLSVSSFIKFATGDKNELIGSGTNDIGLSISGRIISRNAKNDFTWFYSSGYMHIGSGAMLSDVLSKNIVFGSLGTAYKLSTKWIPKIQIDFHSGFYKGSTTKQLGNESVQLVIGADYFISDQLNLSASFSEDLIVNTAPDFVLQFGVSYKLK